MPKLEATPILEQLRSATTYAEQADALRSLKNDIVGHRQKKEAWVAAGVLEPVVKILETYRTPSKRNGKEPRFRPGSPEAAEEESVKIQAMQALSTFANGGPSFLAPIRATGAIGAILGHISPSTNSPQIVHASLRTLTVLVYASASTGSGFPSDLQAIADSLFVPEHIQSLQSILASSSPDSITQAQINLAAALVGRLCRDETHRHALARPNGVLDALATRLASFVVADGLVLPGAERLLKGDGAERIPEPAPRSARLAPILRAIGTIIMDSKYGAYVLLTSPAISSVFPPIQFSPLPAMRATWQAMERWSGSENLSAMDYLLPAIQPPRGSRRPRQKSVETRDNKPIPGTSVQGSLPQSNGRVQDGASETEEPESPLIPYLIHMSRTSHDDMVRLMAVAVLVPLMKAGFATNPVRESTVALFVVPTLVQLMREHLDRQCQNNSSPSVDEPTRDSWEILERTPELLDRLILDNETLQRAAFECGAAETLAKLLQEAYNPALSTQPRMWTAQTDTTMDTDEGPTSCRLGQDGILPLLLHRTRLRESALKGIHAVAGQDEYRKSIVDLDTVPYIVESLLQYPGKPLPAKERQAEKQSEVVTPGYGENPSTVIIAACQVIRMLSRAISVLRTALVDFSVWVPILKFMRHPDVNVQIAAAGAMCNLVLEVSPMREPLIEQKVMTILCEHTRSSNAALRLNALWGLKHLVLHATPAMKKSCLEELEPGLLVRLICDDTEDNALVSSRGGGESLAFDHDDTMDEDVDMQQSEERKGFVFGTGADEGSGRGRSRQVEERLSRYRESEVNPIGKAREDDLAIQEQGLNFIRNLIMGEHPDNSRQDGSPETTQLVDYLFSQLGQDRFLSILESKLRPKVTRPFSRRNSNRESRVVYPQPKIIEAVTYILVHMAASAPRHRQLVISQTNMLKQLGTYFGSKDPEVRAALCHLVTNLTWQETAMDAAGCKQRAQELRKLGFLGKVEGLREEDDMEREAIAYRWKEHFIRRMFYESDPALYSGGRMRGFGWSFLDAITAMNQTQRKRYVERSFRMWGY